MVPNRSTGVHHAPETMHEFLLAAGRLTPDKPAIVESDGADGFTVLTYRQLEQLSQSYAYVLAEFGLDIGDRVVLESDSSGSAIAMLLACSSLGLAFIPVGPQTPQQRLLSIVDTTQAALHLQAHDGARTDLPETLGRCRFGPGGVVVEHAPVPRVRRRREIVGTDPAYMIFTSGTTGRPKGVVMSHRGVLAFYRGMLQRGIVTAEDRVATTSPLQFDFALLDIGLALGSGATLVPVPRSVVPWPRPLLDFLRDAEVTHVDGVPSIWRPILRHESAKLAELDRIRGILFSGENFPVPELRELRKALPHLRIVNCFGPTEAMAFSLTDVPNPIPDNLEKLSIGYAYPGAEMLLITEDGEHVDEPGVVGQIHLRGPSLFNGYWDDPDATRAALVPDPLDPRSGQIVLRSGDLACRGERGELYFCGRADSQVKIRGNRIELGEVERRLAEFPGVAAAAAFVRETPGREPVLSAFVLLEPGIAEIDTTELGGFCRTTMPDYMIPRNVRALDELPVTPNGKTDRRALAALAGVR